MKKIKVIGIGSRIMGDDGIGVYVVEELIKQQFMSTIEYVEGETDNNIEYVVGETDNDYCLDYMDNASSVIIIDAALSGKKPGTVTEFTSREDAFDFSMMFSPHKLNLIGATRLLLNTQSLIIIGIEPETVDYQLELSDTLSTAFIQIIEDVKKCLLKFVQ